MNPDASGASSCVRNFRRSAPSVWAGPIRLNACWARRVPRGLPGGMLVERFSAIDLERIRVARRYPSNFGASQQNARRRFPGAWRALSRRVHRSRKNLHVRTDDPARRGSGVTPCWVPVSARREDPAWSARALWRVIKNACAAPEPEVGARRRWRVESLLSPSPPLPSSDSSARGQGRGEKRSKPPGHCR
jgi:hypothetical protein